MLDLATPAFGAVFEKTGGKTKGVTMRTLHDNLGSPFFALDLARAVKAAWAEWAAAHTKA